MPIQRTHSLQGLMPYCNMQGPVAASAAMAPLHRSNTDGPPRRAALPNKASLASLKSKGSILSHVTSGTWEEDADIEGPSSGRGKEEDATGASPCQDSPPAMAD